MKFTLEPASDGVHKWVGVFTDPVDKTERRIPFGAKGYSDYTINRDPLRRERYIARHKARENWRDPMTAGALSRFILWGDSTDIRRNVRQFKQRFNLE
jgi:hypothetical protein